MVRHALVRLALRTALMVVPAVLVCVRARADGNEVGPTGGALTWVAPDGCPTQAELAAELRFRIGPLPAGWVNARAVAERSGERWTADVLVSVGPSTRGNRHVEGETCRAVADAVIVIVALAVSWSERRSVEDSGAAMETARESIAPAPAPVAAASHVELRRATARPTAARESVRPGILLGASLVLDDGTLPAIGYGGEVTAALVVSRLQLGITGVLLAPEKATVAGTNDGAHFWVAEVGGRGCVALPVGSVFGLAPCVGGAGQWVFADGFGSTLPASVTDHIAIASFGARGTLRLSSHAFVQLGAEAVVPFTRPVYVVDHGGDVFRASAAAGRATLGVEAQY